MGNQGVEALLSKRNASTLTNQGNKDSSKGADDQQKRKQVTLAGRLTVAECPSNLQGSVLPLSLNHSPKARNSLLFKPSNVASKRMKAIRMSNSKRELALIKSRTPRIPVASPEEARKVVSSMYTQALGPLQIYNSLTKKFVNTKNPVATPSDHSHRVHKNQEYSSI
jgi:hypothetical protein